jgi:hypothetical protein
MTTELTPISTPGPGQTLCTAQKEDEGGYHQVWSCTRELGHPLPHEAAGEGGTVFARWVDWTRDRFDGGEPAPVAPVVVPTPSRPARIAALHAAGLFLAENTDLPMPGVVEMICHDVPADRLRQLATVHGAEIHQRSNSRWLEIIVGLETLHGIAIRYIAFEER